MLDEIGTGSAWFVGYDIGSRLVQHLLDEAPERVLGAVMTPPLPGEAERMLAPAVQQEFWYQKLHRLSLADELIDGRPDAVRGLSAALLGSLGPATDSRCRAPTWNG